VTLLLGSANAEVVRVRGGVEGMMLEIIICSNNELLLRTISIQANNFQLIRASYLLKVFCVLTRIVVYSAHVMHQYWTLHISHTLLLRVSYVNNNNNNNNNIY
jgi:hypothetical protein